MTMELHGWLVPLGARGVAGVGVLLIHVSTRRREARLRDEARRRHAPAE